MKIRSLTYGLASVTFAVTLVLSGCSSGEQSIPPIGGDATVGTTNDMNPQDPNTLQQGGNLRLALPSMRANFNPLTIDGNDETQTIHRATLPRAFTIAPDGSATVNPDYFTSVELTSENPQVVTYTINPKAVWSDGTPITWEDLASQIQATNGKDKRYLIPSSAGSDRVASVTRGVDDRQAVITFAQHYTEWKGMFAGNSMLQPKKMTENPEVFNKGQLNGPGPSAGPFIISNVDRTAQRITLTRNPKWWGATPRLDSITYLVLDDAARVPALQNNTIDATGIASLDELQIVRNTPGIAVRRAPTPQWYHFTFNGAPGSILADPALRVAVAKGIDRQAIANISQRGLVDNPTPLNNHVFVAGQEGYQDNSAVVAFDPEKAKAELDALGWKMNGQFREKDGRQLTIRDVFYDAKSTRQIAQVAQNSLAQIGVNLQLEAKPGTGFFTDWITVGNFDIAQFAWGGDAFPLSSLQQTYKTGSESNFGKISTPEIDAKVDQVLDELDAAKARDLANEADKLIFAEGFSLPLFQTPGNVAVRSTLANFGAAGLGDVNYTAIGFMKS
ncbi:ABC transporter family substrate-binding protein [Mycolicibacterium fluoranthenivorans]|uniref:Peptide/nickel transport system substrate-binding protein n=1 Tax=Mycolicibacterium fluoranthenivorans TaxID=258505 RepID=A0A7X5U4U9_9MYCO|nr:ABC transporter family substrate-binding protein [Mycolicibacterium fluoranthenivorans]MCV7355981.1 ABC transporter family substrate-binding protein [Mycolicibacterium fluoranthenivorans]NIH98454.1 peptide/nickel transport system substrate-binding protein [Mycolicibacterium fluoranthenivorans]